MVSFLFDTKLLNARIPHSITKKMYSKRKKDRFREAFHDVAHILPEGMNYYEFIFLKNLTEHIFFSRL